MLIRYSEPMSIHTPLALALRAIATFRSAQQDKRFIKMDEVLVSLFKPEHDASTRRLAYARSMDVVRRAAWAETTVTAHLHRPCPKTIFELLMLGAVEICYPPRPIQTTINQLCNYAKTIHPKFGGFVYGVLKKISRLDPPAQERHCPEWIYERLASYGAQRDQITQAWLTPPTLFIRHHPWRISAGDFETMLHSADIATERHPRGWHILTPTPIHRLPGYAEGLFYVQDPHAAIADDWLAQQRGRLWDACAAPGGKTLAALAYPDLKVFASDIHPKRLERLKDNLKRAQPKEWPELFCHDATQPTDALYDAILLDAPCSGSGVFSKHPERKWLLTPTELEDLEQRQRTLLKQTWQQLKAGGRLLYMTCSVFPSENEEQIEAFLKETPSAEQDSKAPEHAKETILPSSDGHGGFYLCWLSKKA